MEAQPNFKAFAAADGAVSRDRGPFGARAESSREARNARGLVIAVSMSAACWAVIALAFLL